MFWFFSVINHVPLDPNTSEIVDDHHHTFSSCWLVSGYWLVFGYWMIFGYWIVYH